MVPVLPLYFCDVRHILTLFCHFLIRNLGTQEKLCYIGAIWHKTIPFYRIFLSNGKPLMFLLMKVYLRFYVALGISRVDFVLDDL